MTDDAEKRAPDAHQDVISTGNDANGEGTRQRLPTDEAIAMKSEASTHTVRKKKPNQMICCQ